MMNDSIPSSQLTVRRVSTLEEFHSLRESWNALVDDSVYPNIFTTWEWSSVWWKWYGEQKLHGELFILVVESQETVVGIFPLYRLKGKVPLLYPKKQLNFIGYGELPALEYLGPIIRSGWTDSVCDCAVQFFQENISQWDSLFFESYALDDPGSCQFAERMKACFPSYSQEDEVRYNISLAGMATYDAYLSSLSSHNRNNKRNRMRQAVNRFQATWHEGTLEDFEEWYPILVNLTEDSRKRRSEKPLFARRHYSDFQSDLLKSLLPMNRVCVYYIKYEGVPSAVLYSYLLQGKCYAYQIGLASSQLGSPGDIIFQSMIKKTIEDKGVEFDFLRGGEWYKSQYTDTGRQTEMLAIFSRKSFAYSFALWIYLYYRPLRHKTKLALVGLLSRFRAKNNKERAKSPESAKNDAKS